MPGNILSPLYIKTHLIFIIIPWLVLACILILQVRKIRHKNIVSLTQGHSVLSRSLWIWTTVPKSSHATYLSCNSIRVFNIDCASTNLSWPASSEFLFTVLETRRRRNNIYRLFSDRAAIWDYYIPSRIAVICENIEGYNLMCTCLVGVPSMVSFWRNWPGDFFKQKEMASKQDWKIKNRKVVQEKKSTSNEFYVLS